MGSAPFKVLVNAPTHTTPWSSSGVREHPDGCRSCRFDTKGTGFCPDDDFSRARVAALFAHPRQDDVVEQKALASGTGKYFLQHFVYSLGHKREELAAAHCIRCVPPRFKGKYTYPAAVNRDAVENACRQYDTYHGERGRLVTSGIAEWNPNIVMVCFDPADIFQTVCLSRLVGATMQKAWNFAADGYRPLVLMGKEPMELCAPWLDGGCKRWNGHYQKLEDGWAFRSKGQDKNLKGFKVL